jgi:hypothetical protein
MTESTNNNETNTSMPKEIKAFHAINDFGDDAGLVYSKEKVDELVAQMRHRYDQMRFRMQSMESGLCQMYASELADCHIQIVKQRVGKANALVKYYSTYTEIWRMKKQNLGTTGKPQEYEEADKIIAGLTAKHEKWLNVYNRLIKYYFSLSGRYYCDFIKPKLQNIERDVYLLALKFTSMEETLEKVAAKLEVPII